MQARGLTFFQKTKDVFFNVRYKLISLFEEYDLNRLLKVGDNIYLLGKAYSVREDSIEQISQEVYAAFKRTAWVTYRSGFPQIFGEEVQNSYVSDTGWGCMIRVGQMAFAQVIKEHLALQENEQAILRQVISLFDDCDASQPFSILNIARLARTAFGLQPGNWYNPSQISYVLAKLHRLHLQQRTSLSFIVFNSGNLFYEQIRKKMKACNCPLPCNCKRMSVGVVCLARIGLDHPQEKYLSVLNLIMKMKTFRGLIGGKPKKALYFLGRYNEDYMYLDPHYVHAAKDLSKEAHFCASFRKIPSSHIDSSIGLVFYLRDNKDLQHFIAQIEQIKQARAEDFFLFAADKTPNYMASGAYQIKEIVEEDKYISLG